MATLATTRLVTRATAAEIVTRRHPLQPSSLNAETRTVDVVLSAFADVRRTYGIERLSADPAGWEIPADGVPLLDGHRTGSFRDILGRVRNIRIEGGQMLGTAHISNDDAWAAVERGDLTGVSIGYAISKFSDSRASSGRLTRSVTGATLMEASLLPIPADPSATVRSPDTMEEDEIESSEVNSEPETRAEINTHIRAFETRGVSRSFIDTLIDDEPSLADANARILTEMGNRRPVVTVGRSSEDPTVVRGLQAEALAATYTGEEPSEAARQYVGLGMQDHMRLTLARSGERNVNALGTDALVTRAMGSTSDFPIVLDDAGNRIVLSAYRAAESPLKRIAVQRNIPDFRDMTAIRTGGLPTLKKVTEAGEVKHATIPESGEKFKLDTYASIFGLTRQVLINDRFGILADFARNAGIAAANTERELLLSLFLEGSSAGPVMSDGNRVFHANHGNLADVSDDEDAALHVGSLSTARQAMRNQTGIDGVTLINAAPKFLLVGDDLETDAEKVLAELSATTVDGQNPFAGKLTLLVEPGLEEGSWYVVAAPEQVPTLAYGYLSSAPGPQLASREGWEVLGREWRVVLDFGAGFLDWRGIYRNPGEDI